MRPGSTPRALVVVVGLLAIPLASAQESPLDSAQARAAGRTSALPSSADVSLSDRLQAIRAAPFARAPEDALPDLLVLARGRDATLAPAAAVAIRRITERLDRGGLDAREADLEALARVRDGLRALARDGSARGDIRRLAGLAASELAALIPG